MFYVLTAIGWCWKMTVNDGATVASASATATAAAAHSLRLVAKLAYGPHTVVNTCWSFHGNTTMVPHKSFEVGRAIRALVSCCLTNLAAHSFGRSKGHVSRDMRKQETQRRARLRFPHKNGAPLAVSPSSMLLPSILSLFFGKPSWRVRRRNPTFLPRLGSCPNVYGVS
jgi:hypothetical protein